jgi:hypothetical protein
MGENHLWNRGGSSESGHRRAGKPICLALAARWPVKCIIIGGDLPVRESPVVPAE